MIGSIPSITNSNNMMTEQREILWSEQNLSTGACDQPAAWDPGFFLQVGWAQDSTGKAGLSVSEDPLARSAQKAGDN